MSRFEIEDIVSQDQRGIVFRAHDLDRGHTVALRRFLPFGQDGGGLKDEESDAFRIAAHRLLGVTHPALRSVFSGAVDPIDEIPYIVAEWVDGAKLDDVLAGETLDPRLVIQLLRLALEVSLSLSEILGEEAVWVETETDSIFVGSEESGRGFVFWLSPFKWLGAEFGSRKLAALVGLGEHLAGWKGKLIGDQAGHGLGGWLKWMRNNPEAGLAQALEAMPSRISDGEAPPPPPAAVRASPPVAGSRVVAVKPPRSTAPLVIAVAACLVLAIGGLAFYQRFAKTPSAPIAKAEAAPDKPAAAEPAPAAATSTPSPQPSQDAEAVAVSRVNELAAKLAGEKEAKRTAALAPPDAKAAPSPLDLTPGDGDKVRKLKAKGAAPASVTGILRDVRLSSNGNGLYFDFSKPADFTQIMGIAHKQNYKGAFSPDAYADLIGRKVRFDGTYYREKSGRQYVKIREQEMVRVVE